jgi:hypothetical protein
MNAETLIATLGGMVQEPSLDAEGLLAKLNAAQLAVAEEDGIFLPALADGIASITAEAGEMFADLPLTYHKRFYLAKNTTTNGSVIVFDNIGMMAQSLGDIPSISLQGDVYAITVHAGRVLFQRTPTANQTISTMFYRLPVPMTESNKSFPDGLLGSRSSLVEDAFDRALLHHAAWRIFSGVEQGLEGRKVDTEYHFGEFRRAIADLASVCRPETILSAMPVNSRW